METRARYALIGLFVLAIIIASFGFVYWLENKGGFGERKTYRVQFESSVSGLLVGSAVLFNGIRVGEVTGIALNPNAPQQVIATISVVEHTPIREDTQVNVEQQGLTGGIAVTLTGGTSTTQLPSEGGAPPTLIAPPGVGQDWTQSARDAFQQVDDILEENAKPLNQAIENIEVFTDALARNADKVDGILAGIERMTGGGKGDAPLYSLTAVTDVPKAEQKPNWLLVISEPTTLLALNTDKILTQPAPDEILPLDNARWTDSVPILAQAKIIQTFENAGYTETVSRIQEGVAPTYRLGIDIRKFHIATEGSPEAEVVFLVRLLDPDGETVATKLFEGSAPTAGSDVRDYVDALSKTFGKLQVELLEWTVAELDDIPVPPVTVEPPAPGELPPEFDDMPPEPDAPTP
jgi:phospholipid/cholesterol/gamma-HCH transport system substrate-binding protein